MNMARGLLILFFSAAAAYAGDGHDLGDVQREFWLIEKKKLSLKMLLVRMALERRQAQRERLDLMEALKKRLPSSQDAGRLASDPSTEGQIQDLQKQVQRSLDLQEKINELDERISSLKRRLHRIEKDEKNREA